jgi:hypothetical protein
VMTKAVQTLAIKIGTLNMLRDSKDSCTKRRCAAFPAT